MRQFLATTLPNKNGYIQLTEKERRYLINVLRKKNGDKVDVRLPNNTLCIMTVVITKAEGKSAGGVSLMITAGETNTATFEELSEHSFGNFWLFQILPKGQKMDLIVRQATESGVSRIVPIIGDYTVGGKSFGNHTENATKVDRWMRIVREAKQQSGSAVDTKILNPCSMEDAMDLWKDDFNNESMGFVLHEKQERQESLFSLIQKINDYKNVRIGFVVGCEGGISPKEHDVLKANSFYPIHFNTNILRAETAALYGMAVLQTLVVENSKWKELKE